MARSYTLDQLLNLRESPLVRKPSGLPPVEEWMGSIPEPRQAQNQNQNQNLRRLANKGTNDDNFLNDSSTNRRSMFEARARSTTVPEDIVLGPPKTAFASASGARSNSKISSTPQRSSFTNHDDPTIKDDRTTLRDKFPKDGQRIERDGEKRDSKSGATQNRRSVKDDSDLWSNVRQQRNLGHDDHDRTHQKNGDREYDRDREGGREHRAQRGFENHRRDVDADADGGHALRRIGPARGRNEPSWNREEGHNEDAGAEVPENAKPRDWRDKERRGARGSERDWNRGGKVELDPEWMDEPEPEIKEQKRTQEDFERWKERMKASNGATQDTPLLTTEQRPTHDRTVSSGGAGVAKAKVETPLIVDPSFDGFFGLWDNPRKGEEVLGNSAENGVKPNVANTAAKVSKPSKFTGFFHPKADPEAPKEQPSLPLFAPFKNSSHEDKEGFQRILKLLDQQQTQGGNAETSPRVQGQRDVPASPPIQSRGAGERSDLYSLLGTRSSQENTVPPTRDGEFLLRLMQQPQQNRQDINQVNVGGRRPAQDTAPGLSPFSNLMISPHETPQQTPSNGFPPGFFSADEMQPRDKLNPTSGAERRGHPPGIYDQRPSPAGAPQQSGFPSALQRPPGLEQLPPGYAQHLLSQRQNMVPPPGFQAPPRGQNAFPPGLIPGNPSDRLQYGMPSNNRGMHPPGYMGMSAPPPGFPLPLNQEGMPFAGFGDTAGFGQGGQGFMPGQPRR
ncbi:MAG: hypothetical protein ASARMPRED_000798 [Alectoria sarmentosa]|nr:MAG: hypothetical protein ASARMPRED_000798 [Alectoria sarmentosa]